MRLCYTENDTVVLDPNVQVQATMREVFRRFERVTIKMLNLLNYNLLLTSTLVISQTLSGQSPRHGAMHSMFSGRFVRSNQLSQSCS